METPIYENHSYPDPNFPIIFHTDIRSKLNNHVYMHYHENIELLCFIHGNGIVTCGTTQIQVNEGDTVIVNADVLHSIKATSPLLRYHCLIVDKMFCENFHIYTSNIYIKNIISDHYVNSLFNKISVEMEDEKLYYKSVVKASSIDLMVHLCRNYVESRNNLSDDSSNNKIILAKKAIDYIKNNFSQDISIDNICSDIGFSKYYFCRVFKEITGKTVVDYINFLRCDYARKLLTTGKYNVSEIAEISGFKNLSYFSKTYKKYMGNLPSEDK